MTGSLKGRGNQYIEFIRDVYCKLLPNGKQLPAFPLEAMTGIEPRPQFIFCLFGILRRFQHCTGHITTGSWKGRGNQYIEFARVVYCKLPTNGKQLPAFPLTAMTGINPRPQRREARVLPLCHRGPPRPQRWEARVLPFSHHAPPPPRLNT